MEDEINPIIIETKEDYETLCRHIENDKPSIVEIGADYFVTEDDVFEISAGYRFVLEDVLDYHINGLPEKVELTNQSDNVIVVEGIPFTIH